MKRCLCPHNGSVSALSLTHIPFHVHTGPVISSCSNKACEAVSNALYKMGGVSALVALWGCKAIVGLSATESNRIRFHHSETCNAVVAALKVRQSV